MVRFAKICTLVSVLFFVVCTSLSAQAVISIKSFNSQKLLHDFDQVVTLEAVLVNNSDAEQAIIAEVIIRKGVDTDLSIGKKEVTIGSGSTKEVTFEWNPGKQEYGFAAFLHLKDETGKAITVSKPAIFEVCRDWWKVSRQSALCTYHHYLRPEDGNFKRDMNKVISKYRALYVNVHEFFGDMWPQKHDYTPTEDQWEWYWADHPSNKRKRKPTNKASIKKWIKELHGNGIKVIGYMHVLSYNLFDESWKLFDRSTGKMKYDYAYVSEKNEDQRVKKNLVLPHVLKFADHLSGQLAASIKEYDWDGWFLDSFVQLPRATASAVDKNGKPVTTYTADELYAQAMKTLSTTVHAVKPSFTFVPNGLHHMLGGVEQNPSRDMFGEDLSNFDHPKGNEHVRLWFYEGQTLQRGRANTPWQIGRSLRAVKEATGRPVWGVYAVSRNPVTAIKPLVALLLSNGLGYWDHGGSELPHPNRSEKAKAIGDYMRFACRYGQYLYDLNIHWTPKGMVEIDSPDHVYWKGNTFYREFEDRTEVYVHALNYDRSYIDARLINRGGQNPKVPKVVEDLKVVLNLKDKYSSVDAFYLTADDEVQEAAKIPAALADNKVNFKIPKLEYWSLVVVKLYK